MDRRTLYGLLGALALLAGVSLFIGQQEADSPQQLPTLPGLTIHSEQIDAITVTAAGGNTIARLSDINGTWVELGSGYPANATLIKTILRQLAKSKNIEAKTTRADRYARLGLQEITQQDARGTRLQLSTTPTSTHGTPEFSAAIILGDKTNSGQFARIEGEAQSWLTNTSLQLPDDSIDWLSRELLDIAAAELVAITIIHPNKARLELVKPVANQPDFQLTQSRADGRVTNPNRIAGILSGLRFESVQPAVAGAERAKDVTVGEFMTRDGVLITSRTWSNSEGQFFNFDIRDTTGQSDTTEIEILQARLSGWTYTLPAYKAEQFLTTTSDLLK